MIDLSIYSAGVILLVTIILIAAAIYIAGKTGILEETTMMLILLPLMLGIVVLSCITYYEWGKTK